MVVISEFLATLPNTYEQLAGHSEAQQLATDVVPFNYQEQVWLTRQKADEFEGTLIFIQSQLFPGYLSTFDLLIRFLKQAGAAGVLFQGGKKSDFSKATLMLADNLNLPLIWIPEPLTYSVLARKFYGLLMEAQERKKVLITCARRRLEHAYSDVFTLQTWVRQVEHELDCEVSLRLSQAAKSESAWRTRVIYSPEAKKGVGPYDKSSRSTPHLKTAQRVLAIPMQIVHENYELILTPRADCDLYCPDIEQLWIDELSGTLVAQASYLFLLETPGVALEHQWATSFESLIYLVMASLPMFKSFQTGISPDGPFPETVGSVSLKPRLSLIPMSEVQSVSVLWVTQSHLSSRKDATQERPTDKKGVSVNRPYAYRVFREDTMRMRDEVVDLVHHGRFSPGLQQDLTSTVPWRDWQMQEGIVVVWFPTANTSSPTERMIRDLTSNLSTRLKFPYRAFFHREEFQEEVTTPEDLLRAVTTALEKSYTDFLFALENSEALQFSSYSQSSANRMIQGTGSETSYQHALEILQPILDDKNRGALVDALEAFLESGGKIQHAADSLHLHRNTLRYRLNRAEELLGTNLANAENRFTYHLAIRTWRLQHHATKQL